MSLENTEYKHLSIVREWLQNDEKFRQEMKKLVNALDLSGDMYIDDHDWKNHKLESVLLIQKQQCATNAEMNQVVWIGKQRIHGINEGDFRHDNVWCCPFPTLCKNQLYLAHSRTPHVTRLASGQDLTSERSLPSNKEAIQISQTAWW